ncbi:Sua5/YciO/YrdC/YwlC family protein [Halorhabdus utahensis DSM 12940]|uniref:L-threonylcarbamoyladenylate synthase n=1 Tax=Halorhabdus utahensis (strain DSM 12940 / JCM 11049 / AX-2) TaxID=519442 RepID=C7NPD5_HALUD|nr:L-threonylcarbamoyladenylate synthase [Halorhabdus utahensis]ACV11722.1 Sua5/YciO/YrdC/YwlC family protein [Halorhabdus utahensis DSM 12940]
MTRDSDLTAAAEVVKSGGLVVYPTETVYGLGADALDTAAIEAVFETKRRDRDNPLSLGVASVEAALDYVSPSVTEQRFMQEFLPGPVTVVVEGRDPVPDALTGGRDRVGVRIPDHDLARELLERSGPLTATSANVSGQPSVTDPADLDAEIRTAAGVILDGGETPGTASTVVDVSRGTIHRRGANADAVEDWLETHSA